MWGDSMATFAERIKQLRIEKNLTQEELASLSYLITMCFMKANGDEVERVGERFHSGLKEISKKYSDRVIYVEGMQLLAALTFKTVDAAADFASKMKKKCIDASAQIYKANCVPAVLMKPPVISTEATVDFILDTIDELLKA